MRRRSVLFLPVALAAAQAPVTTRPRVAAIVNTYFPNSHADVFLSRLLDGYHLEGVRHEPRLQLVSLYVDQTPANDLSREVSREYGVKIYSTIAEALRCGGVTLQVDGVVHIGEHGDYPPNEKGQKMYPRRKFFDQIVKVMEDDHRVVPMYTDKHFSYEWSDALAMYRKARQLQIPWMAGSTVSLTQRVPPLELAPGTELDEAMVIAFGDLEAYGFHALEALQAIVERRKGCETGVASVQAIRGPQVWELEGRAWSRDLFDAALARTPTAVAGKPEALVKDPVLFVIRYRDGLKGCVLMCNGLLRSWVFAARTKPTRTVLSTDCRISFGLHTHWGYMVRNFEELVIHRRIPNPVERTLLTTGILAFAFDSLYRQGTEIETPQLAISYRA